MTIPPLSSLVGSRAILVASLLLAAGCSNTSGPQSSTTATTTGETAPGAFNDDPRPLTPNESIVVGAGLDVAKLAAAERKLLDAMIDPAADPAAAQDAAQQLGFVMLAGTPEASAATLEALAPLLADPERSEFARLALDRVPGPAVDALYLDALTMATGRTRLGLLDIIGTRYISDAVPVIAPLLRDEDPATSAAAALALGRIGTPAAFDALAEAPAPLTPTILNAQLIAASLSDASIASRLSAEIYRNPAAPLAQRSAALRQLIAANPAAAIAEIHGALAGSEPAVHAVALESVATLPTPGSAAALADRLGSYAVAVQVPLIAALGNLGDADAVPGLLRMLENSEASVRLAAIEALGRLPGNPLVAEQLATLATGQGEEAKTAFASLTRLHGPDIDGFIHTNAAADLKVSLRTLFLQQLAARNQTEALPFLFSLREATEPTLRLEALDALRMIAPPADQQAVIDWALGAKAKAEQTRAVRALITIILRADDEASRAKPVVAALKSGDVAARLTLLPVLSRIAGPTALTAAGSLALSEDEAVATAATAELARWPNATALPVLVSTAVGTRLDPVRNAAAQGAARFLMQSSEQTRERRSMQARALLELPLDTSARLTLIHVLSLCADEPSLETVRRFLADPATAQGAQDAVDAISSNLAGPPVFTASTSADTVAHAADGDPKTSWTAHNEPGVWLRADLHQSRPVRKVTLTHGNYGWASPTMLEVLVSNDPDQPGEVKTEVEGQRRMNVINLPAGTRGRYLWLRQTGTSDSDWSVAELLVE